MARMPRREIPRSSRQFNKIQHEPQYDVDTGSVMSGHYEPEQEPSILFTADGKSCLQAIIDRY